MGTGGPQAPGEALLTAEQNCTSATSPQCRHCHTSLPDARPQGAWSSRGATKSHGPHGKGGKGPQGGRSGASAELAGTAPGPCRRALLPQAGSAGASTWLPAPCHFRGSWAENPSEPGNGRTGRTPSFPGPAPDGIWSAVLFMVKDTGKCQPRATQICYNSPTETFTRWPLLAPPTALRAPAMSSSCSGAASGTNSEFLCPRALPVLHPRLSRNHPG